MRTYLFLIITLILSVNLSGQTLVSTEVEPRNAVLEEYTGINCINCPSAHEIAQEIKGQYPEDFFIINHHTGFFATPDPGQPNFVTIYGAFRDQKSGLIGYPAGEINRHRFPDYLMNPEEPFTAQYKSTWEETTEIVLSENSFVNIGVEADWDYLTNEITVHVEAYFTSDSPLPENLINVALMQDSTFAYQIGRGDNYLHNNRLVDYITPWDGHLMSNTTQGSFYDETFTYVVPSDYNDIPVDISNLKIITFLAGYPYEIETGTACNITYSNIPGHDVSVLEVEEVFPKCTGLHTPKVKVRNNAGQEITSINFEYNIEGQSTHYYNWTGSLTSYTKATITLPEFAFDLNGSNNLEVKIINTDDVTSNNDISITFVEDSSIIVDEELLIIEMQCQYEGSRITWEVLNASDDVVLSGGPYEDWNSEIHTASTTLDPNSCYSIFFYDSAPNPMEIFNGFYNVISGGEIIATGTDILDYTRVGLKTTEDLTTNVELSLSNILISPNPASKVINVSNAEGMKLELFDLLGKRIYTIDKLLNQSSLNVSDLENGIYYVKISNEFESMSTKVLVLK